MDKDILQSLKSDFFKGIVTYPLSSFKEQLNNKTLNGVYIFVITDCVLCKNHVANWPFRNKNILNCYEDWDYFRFDLKLDDMPTTRLYKNGECVFECVGVMYDRQLNKLKNAISEYKV